jgi:hypothetical protein
VLKNPIIATLLTGSLTILAGYNVAATDSGFSSLKSVGAAVVTDRLGPVPVCHYDYESTTYERIEVPALELRAHLAHGDGEPGKPVPGQKDFTYDEACLSVADE